jgi:hypothetical protein
MLKLINTSHGWLNCEYTSLIDSLVVCKLRSSSRRSYIFQLQTLPREILEIIFMKSGLRFVLTFSSTMATYVALYIVCCVCSEWNTIMKRLLARRHLKRHLKGHLNCKFISYERLLTEIRLTTAAKSRALTRCRTAHP